MQSSNNTESQGKKMRSYFSFKNTKDTRYQGSIAIKEILKQLEELE